jgi:biotin carboxyl carrier protein
MAAALVSINVSPGDWVEKDQIIAVVESMKMQTAVVAPVAGLITELNVSVGDTVQDGHLICHVVISESGGRLSHTGSC